MDNEYIERPFVGNGIKLNKRDLVRYWRSQSAYDLAELLTGPGKVTATDADNAGRVLDSIQRWALKHERYFNDDNDERRYNTYYHKEDGKCLDRSYKRLNERLKPYGVRLQLPGIYPVVVSMDGKKDYNLLHWFD